MSKLEILDLSYCELVTEEDMKFQVTGGWSFARNLPLSWIAQVQSVKIPDLNNLGDLGGYEQTEVYSDSESTVKKLKNSKTGESGYEVSSKDGTYRSFVLSGPSWTSASSTSIKYFNL